MRIETRTTFPITNKTRITTISLIILKLLNKEDKNKTNKEVRRVKKEMNKDKRMLQRNHKKKASKSQSTCKLMERNRSHLKSGKIRTITISPMFWKAISTKTTSQTIKKM